MQNITPTQIDFFKENGYLIIENIIDSDSLKYYQNIYQDFLLGKIDSGKNRSDLGEQLGDNKAVENITQIMWPSDFVDDILAKPYHKNAQKIAQSLLGNDLEMDFDMLIDKAPQTNTPTPWHQDAAYWLALPDTRAVSCWMALDDATLDNGCMWYVPKSHFQPIRPHRFAGKEGGALICDCTENEGLAIEIKAGSCILHDGRTLHYSRGNTTDSHRRAYIVNFRPKAMIELERAKGFDHGRSGNAGERKVRS
jgi:phytanoyl-CoA hydroxylase